MIDAGFSGIPVSLKFIKRKANPKTLKQWEDLDKKRRENREDSKVRAVKKTKRVVKPTKAKLVRDIPKPIKRAKATSKGRGK